METLVKAVLATIVVVAMLIASFYMAYVLVVILALVVIGGLALAWFGADDWFTKPYFDD